eukprot:475395-Amphidinium_carterae.2
MQFDSVSETREQRQDCEPTIQTRWCAKVTWDVDYDAHSPLYNASLVEVGADASSKQCTCARDYLMPR